MRKEVKSMKIKSKKLSTLFGVNLLKTLYFNFHYLNFKQAIKLPILIYWRTRFHAVEGGIRLMAPAKTGMLRIGVHLLGTQDPRLSTTVWDVSGTLEVGGLTYIGRGTKLSIGDGATLSLGEGFCVTGNSEIICKKQICFGNNCLVSWSVLLMDTDFHLILDSNNVVTNVPSPIIIGNHAWIGCRSTILKGVSLPEETVVAAGSLISRSFSEKGCVIGGQGRDAAVLKRDISWKLC